MIKETIIEKDLHGNGPVTDYQYFGKDAVEFLKSKGFDKDIEYLGKECITYKDKRGIIIGIENSNSFLDYYFIIYLIEGDKLCYELLNNASFTKSIIV